MCGIAGFLDSSRSLQKARMQDITEGMSDSLRHRGPDAQGVWLSEAAGVALGHRRLSILDLTPSGAQPMISRDSRWVITYNGEVYNFVELRTELANLGHTFKGGSDTEVILAAFSEWGIEKSIPRFTGMFAIAVWDQLNHELWLIRDRLGEKPLYYGWQDGFFIFASELRAFKMHPAFKGEVDRNSITLLLRHNCIPAPYSIYKGILKLPPASFLKISARRGENGQSKNEEPLPYWSLEQVRQKTSRFRGSDADALLALDQHMTHAVRGQMVSDVPLGAFLSGGIDSSLVVALMQKENNRKVRTFTIGFEDQGYDESQQAREVASHLGTDHTEWTLKPSQALAVVPSLAQVYDEPFSDSSQIPTLIVAQLARQHVTVCLSGDGGDEAFAGYNRHLWCEVLWNRFRLAPAWSRRMVAATLKRVSPETWDTLMNMGGKLGFKVGHRLPMEKLFKLLELLDSKSPEEMYLKLVSHWQDPAQVVLQSQEPPTRQTHPRPGDSSESFFDWMLKLDTQTYLPDDILTKVDRATMAASLESRTPFLDHHLIEFAWTLPNSMKVREGQGKWILKQLLSRYLPPELLNRPKAGFGVPIGSWLRGPLKDWAEALLDQTRLEQEGYFNSGLVRTRWEQHLSGTKNWEHSLWDVLMFQAWVEAQR